MDRKSQLEISESMGGLSDNDAAELSRLRQASNVPGGTDKRELPQLIIDAGKYAFGGQQQKKGLLRVAGNE